MNIIRWWWILIVLLIQMPVQAERGLEDCLGDYQPLTVVAVFPFENGVKGTSYTGAGGESIQAYLNVDSGVLQYVVNGFLYDCPDASKLGDLPTITLYPLAGTHWTWAVEDPYGHWSTVRLLDGNTVETPAEYDADGRLITRLVIRRDQPRDASRYHIYDENGNLVG